MKKKSLSYKTFVKGELKNPKLAAAYLNSVLEDGDDTLFLKALKDVAEAMGGLSYLARKTNLNRANLYKIFSGEGNPEYQTLLNILKVLGLSFAVKYKQAA